MQSIFTLVSVILFFSSTIEATECENGWTAYKDEWCVKSFPDLLSYEEGKQFCASIGNSASKSTLVMVKDSTMQDVLADITHDLYDNVWLGSRYDTETEQFKWEDGQPLTYTNWQEGYPKNITDDDVCIELRPTNAKLSPNAEGKWAHVNCPKRNLVICQQAPSWTLQDAVNEIIALRKQLQDEAEYAANERDQLSDRLLSTGNELQATKQDLQASRQEIQSVSAKVVPVGSIYVQYYNQPSPSTLWPSLTWQDISSTYAGQFFRAYGGGSGSWGEVQAGCAPRITQVAYWYGLIDEYPHIIDLPISGTSPELRVGYHTSSGSGTTKERLTFYTSNCEVRPKNQAIRIWKRTR